MLENRREFFRMDVRLPLYIQPLEVKGAESEFIDACLRC